jgi:hypothetical protein
MKKIVHPSYFVFEPANNRLDLTTFPSFNFTYLYAIINVTEGKLIYATAGQSAGLEGSYSSPYLNLTFNTTLMNPTDELQILYNLPAQPIADGDENPIESTIDLDSGERGLNVNLLNSSFGGRLEQPMPTPHEDKALAIAINNGGVLKSPAIDTVTNQLIVDVTQNGSIPVSINNTHQVFASVYNGGSPASFDAGATDANTQRVTANINQISDVYFAGTAQSTAQNNIISGGSTPTECLGYRSFSAQLVCTATAGSFLFEGSNDAVNFQSIPVFNQTNVNITPFTTAISASVSNFIYTGSLPFRYLRIRIASSLTGGTVRAFVKLSPIAFVPTIMAVGQNTASNLNATVVGTLTSVGTITTVSSITAAQLSAVTVTDIALLAITTTQTSANISTNNSSNMAFQVNVTATSGTGQFMDVVVQETFDATNYFDIYHFPRITAIGQYQSPQIRTSGAGIRYVRTVGGTTPSFTNIVVRPQRQTSSDIWRNFANRTIDPNTLNSTTPSYLVEGCDQFQLAVTMNAGGTAPIFKLIGSNDNLNFYDVPSTTLTATVGTSVQVVSSSQCLPKFIKAVTSTAGIGSSLFCLCITGRGI